MERCFYINTQIAFKVTIKKNVWWGGKNTLESRCRTGELLNVVLV